MRSSRILQRLRRAGRNNKPIHAFTMDARSFHVGVLLKVVTLSPERTRRQAELLVYDTTELAVNIDGQIIKLLISKYCLSGCK